MSTSCPSIGSLPNTNFMIGVCYASHQRLRDSPKGVRLKQTRSGHKGKQQKAGRS
ncbi:hypothetical protein Peur_047069 [Populus x canadensis]